MKKWGDARKDIIDKHHSIKKKIEREVLKIKAGLEAILLDDILRVIKENKGK